MERYELMEMAFLVFLFVTLSISLFLYRPFFQDEEFTYNLVRRGPDEFTKQVVADVHPPFYYQVQKGWNTLFGISSAEGMRSLGIVICSISIISMYLLFRRYFNKSWAWLGAFLLGINTYFLFYSTVLRMYNLLIFFNIASWVFLLEYEKTENRLWLWSFFGISTLGVYTHYFFLFCTAGHLLSYFLAHKDRWKQLIRPILAFLLCIIPALLLLAYQSSYEHQITAQSEKYTLWQTTNGIVYQVMKVPIELFTGRFDLSFVAFPLLIVTFSAFILLMATNKLLTYQFITITLGLIIGISIGVLSPYVIASRHYLVLLPIIYISLAKIVIRPQRTLQSAL